MQKTFYIKLEESGHLSGVPAYISARELLPGEFFHIQQGGSHARS
jgi:hypothetical protein